jgi:hypothetical protein
LSSVYSRRNLRFRCRHLSKKKTFIASHGLIKLSSSLIINYGCKKDICYIYCCEYILGGGSATLQLIPACCPNNNYRQGIFRLIYQIYKLNIRQVLKIHFAILFFITLSVHISKTEMLYLNLYLIF